MTPPSEHLDAADPANPLVFGNSVYSVKFDAREHDSMYGHRYTFYLQDAVEEVPEYVVYWDNFVACVSVRPFPVISRPLTIRCRKLGLLPSTAWHLASRQISRPSLQRNKRTRTSPTS